MTEFAFDVKFFASLRVNAADEDQARAMLHDALECTSANLGAWPNGDPILAEVSIDGEADLYEINGEPT